MRSPSGLPDAGYLRRRLEDIIEKAINLLDTLDPDAESEPDLAGFNGATDDREEDADFEWSDVTDPGFPYH